MSSKIRLVVCALPTADCALAPLLNTYTYLFRNAIKASSIFPKAVAMVLSSRA